jgi:hypothetical protein
MPPRYAYWTILIDSKPTAFRARERDELLPTLTQLRRTNSDVVMKWFARGRLWDSPEAERAAQQRPPAAREKRGGDWRPGGTHKDPRDRFKKKNRPEQAWSDKDASVRRDRDKLGPPSGDGPLPGGSSRAPRGSGGGWHDRPAGSTAPRRGDRPWTKPSQPPSGAPRSDRPWMKPSLPPTGAPRSDRPWTKPSQRPTGAPRSDRSWTKSDKPRGPQGGQRAWGAKPQGLSKPWRDKPAGSPPGERPWKNKPRDGRPFTPRGQQPPRKRRDDDPDQK